MTTTRRWGAFVTVAVLAVVVTPSVARAALAISVPTTANLGSVPAGSTSLSGQLGTVTVTDDRLQAVSWTARVSSTDFTTGSGGSSQTIAKGSLSYWSGPATASTGAAVRSPGQLTSLEAQSLSASPIAFSALGVALVANTTSWNPTIVVTIPTSAVAGTYTGTVTHSVA